MKTENLYTPNCIRTVSGRYVNVVDPDPDTIDIEDIAWALSGVPRFGGHLPVTYSVARHSVIVCSMVPDHHKLQALMHDTSDYVFGDLPSPIKQHCPDFRALEDRMMLVLAVKYRFAWPMHDVVKKADREALEFEWRDIMLDPARAQTMQVSREYARDKFLETFYLLTR